MSLLLREVGTCQGVKVQGGGLDGNSRPWQRTAMLGDRDSLLLCFTGGGSELGIRLKLFLPT